MINNNRMGIKGLNKYLNTYCGAALTSHHFNDMIGKKIAIDASIYIYRFLGDNALLEKMYQLLNLFRYYNIIPIFVFDGKPPDTKFKTIELRKKRKDRAEEKYKQLLDSETYTENDLDKLRKQFIRIKFEDLELVKDLLNYYGIMYYDAPGEADKLCARLVRKKKVWACLSEDMDLFAYGCPRVLRYLSLIQKKVILYDTQKILECLNLTEEDLRFICLLTSNDYSNNNNNIYYIIDLFKKYKKSNNYKEIYDEIKKHKNITLINFDEIEQINQYFDVNSNSELKVFEKNNIKFNNIDYEKLRRFLINNNFIIP